MAISGKELSMKIGGMTPTVVPGNNQWSVEETADELDATTAEDNGYEHPEDGVWGAVVTARFVFDMVTGDYAVVRRGTLITDLKLYRDTDDATPAFHFTSFKVLNSTQGGEIRGRLEVTMRGKSVGSYTYNDPA